MKAIQYLLIELATVQRQNKKKRKIEATSVFESVFRLPIH